MKMFVIVREDLGTIYKMVQGSHALAQFALDNHQIFNEWGNQTIVFVDIKDEIKLQNLAEKLGYMGIAFSKFYEPDIDNQLTAIACYSDGKVFSNLKLAKE